MFVLHRDPDIAYLEVTIDELCEVNIHPGELTDQCRQNKDWMYLPQGKDIRLFLQRWALRFPDKAMSVTERWGASFIHKLPRHHPMTPQELKAKLAQLGYTMEDLINGPSR